MSFPCVPATLPGDWQAGAPRVFRFFPPQQRPMSAQLCTLHLQGHSTFSAHHVKGGGDALAARLDDSPGAHNLSFPSYLISSSLGPHQQPRCLIPWETLCTAFLMGL